MAAKIVSLGNFLQDEKLKTLNHIEEDGTFFLEHRMILLQILGF